MYGVPTYAPTVDGHMCPLSFFLENWIMNNSNFEPLFIIIIIIIIIIKCNLNIIFQPYQPFEPQAPLEGGGNYT